MSTMSLPVPRARMRARRAAGFGAGATALALLLAFVGSNVYASLAQRSLRIRWDDARANPAAHAVPRAGDPVARLRIPGANVDAIIVEGPAESSRGPVHDPSTAMPGGNGISVVHAGRLGFGAFFAGLDRIGPDDDVAVQGLDRVVAYRVIDVRRIALDDLDLSDGGDAAILVLIAPASRLGAGERLVVRAKAVS